MWDESPVNHRQLSFTGTSVGADDRLEGGRRNVVVRRKHMATRPSERPQYLLLIGASVIAAARRLEEVSRYFYKRCGFCVFRD